MNLLGKIFVVLILVMSLVFMAMATTVYMTHTNWRNVVMDPNTGLRKKVNDLQAQNQQLNDQLATVQKEIDAERKARDAVLAALESEKETLKNERDQMVKENANLVQQSQQAVVAMDATQKTLEAMRGEIGTLRQQFRQTQQEKEEQFKQVVELTDKLFQSEGERERLDAKNLQLLEQVGRQKLVLDRHGLNEFEPIDGVPPQVDGIVLAINDRGLIEISLGTDDGLRKGHTLEVYRSNRYLGRIEVLETSPDKSVAKIVPQFRQGNIQKEDRVATRLN